MNSNYKPEFKQIDPDYKEGGGGGNISKWRNWDANLTAGTHFDQHEGHRRSACYLMPDHSGFITVMLADESRDQSSTYGGSFGRTHLVIPYRGSNKNGGWYNVHYMSSLQAHFDR